MSERPLSLTKLTAAIGGVLLVASFLLPLVDMKGGGLAATDVFGVGSMRRQIERSRELEAALPLIEPALQQLQAFGDGPSLRNLSKLMGTTKEIVDTVRAVGVAPPEAHALSTVLGATRLGLWLVPLVGVVQAALPAVTRFRGYAGFVGLVARFAFGLVFVTLAALPLALWPEARPFLGPAVYASLLGGALMMASGVAGVTRGNFVFVLLAQAGVLAALMLGLRALYMAAQRAG